MGQQGIWFELDGDRLLGTLTTPAMPGPRPTALLLHGVPGIEKNYDLAQSLQDRGWVCLIFHYRGCWGSHGTYRIETIPDDVRAAVDHLDSGRYAQVDRGNIFLVGHSLGGWAAILAAVRDVRIQGVAVYGAVADPPGLLWPQSYIRTEFTPWLNGISAYEFSRQWAALGTDFSPLEQVRQLSPRPLLILHGAVDQVVPLDQARALYSKAGEPRTIAVHPTADHSFEGHRPWLQEKLAAWLAAHT